MSACAHTVPQATIAIPQEMAQQARVAAVTAPGAYGVFIRLARHSNQHPNLPCTLVIGSAMVSFKAAAILSLVLPVAVMAQSSQATQPSRPSESASRRPAQEKIDTHLLHEIYVRRGKATEKNVPPGATHVEIDQEERALVDVRAEVTPNLQKKVRLLGGTIVWTSVAYRSIIAWVPLLKIEQLAADPAVHGIQPRSEATINRSPEQQRDEDPDGL